uniref:hypothetical protein n=1 Tax=Chloroflexus sp. TaxID=1904827 RepID=UPI002ACE33A2
ELKKRLENLLAKLDGVDRFRLEHSFPTGETGLWLPLGSCGALVLRYGLSSKDFEVAYYPSHEGPLAREPGAARELKAWFAEVVEGTLGGLGMNRYEATIDFDEVATRLPGLDPDAAFRLFGPLTDLALALNEACAVLPMRRAAGKTPKRERVRV